MKTIVFQGDSITDTRRRREGDTMMGSGYATMIAGELQLEHPGEYRVLNRGIGGERIVDIYARMKVDIVNLKPDVVSFLVGNNDLGREIVLQDGLSAEKFAMVYGMLIEELQEALPGVKIIILEPFVLKGRDTQDYWEEYKIQMPIFAQAARQVATEHNLPFVELQAAFDQLAEQTSNEYCLVDGVHPSPAGHELIKQQWLRVFRTMI